MEMLNIVALITDKESTMDPGTGALYAVLAIAMVFVILLIIIGITTLVFKWLGLFELKKELDAEKNKREVKNVESTPSNEHHEVVITDDDMMAAVLVATIDYRNEIGKDVRVVSVKEIK